MFDSVRFGSNESGGSHESSTWCSGKDVSGAPSLGSTILSIVLMKTISNINDIRFEKVLANNVRPEAFVSLEVATGVRSFGNMRLPRKCRSNIPSSNEWASWTGYVSESMGWADKQYRLKSYLSVCNCNDYKDKRVQVICIQEKDNYLKANISIFPQLEPLVYHCGWFIGHQSTWAKLSIQNRT